MVGVRPISCPSAKPAILLQPDRFAVGGNDIALRVEGGEVAGGRRSALRIWQYQFAMGAKPIRKRRRRLLIGSRRDTE